MFRGAKKEDLRLIASELNISVTNKLTIADLNDAIENSDIFKSRPDFVKDIAQTIIENRKCEEQRSIELETMRLERSKNELELAKLRSEKSKSENSESETKAESIDQLIKSIRTLTVRIPIRPEGWSFFFSSLERAFTTKLVPDCYKAEILLNLLGDRASNILTYISDEEISNYEKLKSIVLKEYEPSPQTCLNNFRKAHRLNESHVQFASRLTTNFEYYLKLRNVSDFEKLKQLIVSDKLFETLDKETAAHISIRQADSWFPPQKLASEADLFLSSRGKPFSESASNFQRSKYNMRNAKPTSKVFLSEIEDSKCIFCNQNHRLSKCQKYLGLTINERVEFVKNKNLCFNCLESHRVLNCKSKYSCSLCKKRHHVSLHFSQEKYPINKNESLVERKPSPIENNKTISRHNGDFASSFSAAEEYVLPSPHSATQTTSSNNLFAGASCVSNVNKTVLLSTIVCYLSDESGNLHKVRGICDGGSMSNFLSRDCVDRLQLKREKINMLVSGINDSCLPIKFRVSTTITSKDKSFNTSLDFLVVPQIANLTPSKYLSIPFDEFQNINLADENFNVPGKVDLLLGAEIFYELLRPGQICTSNPKLILQNSVFGFLVSGSLPSLNENKIYCGLIKDSANLDKTLRAFWEIESIEENLPKGKETLFCEEHYARTHTRDKSGRYIVEMPFKEDPSCLGISKDIATKRLNSLWNNRLVRDPGYLTLYKEFLQEYEQLGHMKEVVEEQEPKVNYYMPHFGIYRPQNPTTKLRTVFNASTLTTNNNSLNSLQYNGGVIQQDLFSIMVRFRKHRYAITSDVRRMFRAINIHPSQTCLQRILWKDNIDSEIKTYELTTVTYGTVSAPYLAMRTLKQLSIDEGSKFPLAAPVLVRDMYMDDILSGAETLSELRELKSQLIDIMNCGCMTLHKWFSSDPSLSSESGGNYDFSDSEETKTLGIAWKTRQDCFTFKVDAIDDHISTKRSVLSTIARLYDPLGLLGPVISRAKIFMQRLWREELDWCQRLSKKEEKEWQVFIKSLPILNNLRIKRCILVEEAKEIEIHGFADASEKAYGSVVYLKSISSSGETQVSLVASKSRVAPIKTVTIPRLELCAAVLLAKLCKKVISALNCDVSSILLWSDSTIVLSWLQKEPADLKIFVGNRVAKIQELTDVSQWHYVKSKQNPADLVSRGLEPESLLSSDLWWNGPGFLTQNNYPINEISDLVSDRNREFEVELKNSVSDSKTCLSIFEPNSIVNDIINISNNYLKLIRVTSFIFRFIYNCRNRNNKQSGPLTATELNNAENLIIKAVQGESFAEEIKSIKRHNKVNSTSKVSKLNPFLDKDNVLRVNGRLGNVDISFNKKFPIILPKKHKLTKIIGIYYHVKNFHLNATSLLYRLREKFWPLGGRSMCRRIVHECIICFKAKPVACSQIMGNLPKDRVELNYPFNCSGVDLCGPFLIKSSKLRKSALVKVYVCIFICFVFKAVHIEIVSDLTSASFIATLKRFIARRGKCAKLYSDNAKNFVGANKELKRFNELISKPNEELANYLSEEGIDWKFIPARSPNFGGLWEAAIKSFKFHFKRVTAGANLTYEELLTVVVQIEGILNSRPIAPLSENVDDLEVLTPAHFLINRSLHSIIEPDLTMISDNRLKNWQKITKIVQLIWKKWHRSYLCTLQQRGKWKFEKDNVHKGDLVLLIDDNLPPHKWSIGRITEVFQGNDKKVRVVQVKTQFGLFKRGISKICLLPIPKTEG